MNAETRISELEVELARANTHATAMDTARLVADSELCSLRTELARSASEIERLENLTASDIHTCSDQCQRPLCVMRRELARAVKERDRYHDALIARHGGEPVALLDELDEARAELARVTAERNEAKAAVEWHCRNNEACRDDSQEIQLRAELATLRRELAEQKSFYGDVAALRRDKERLDWLNSIRAENDLTAPVMGYIWGEETSHEDLRGAIDAAMAQEGGARG